MAHITWKCEKCGNGGGVFYNPRGAKFTIAREIDYCHRNSQPMCPWVANGSFEVWGPVVDKLKDEPS